MTICEDCDAFAVHIRHDADTGDEHGLCAECFEGRQGSKRASDEADAARESQWAERMLTALGEE